jgi:hypothetical protein
MAIPSLSWGCVENLCVGVSPHLCQLKPQSGARVEDEIDLQDSSTRSVS